MTEHFGHGFSGGFATLPHREDPNLIFTDPGPAWLLTEPQPAWQFSDPGPTWLFDGGTMRRSALTEDWLLVPVQSLAAPGNPAIVLDAQDVWIAAIPADQARPDPFDLVPAEWVGVAGTRRTARAMFGPGQTVSFTAGTYTVWAKIDGGTWVIVEPAYEMIVN